jgi:AraC-like DNA-binding protein
MKIAKRLIPDVTKNKNFAVLPFFRIFVCEMATTLYIKNMVCDRCKMAVDKTLRGQGLHPMSIELGEVTIEDNLQQAKYEELRNELSHIGFELLDDKRERTLSLIKSAIIRLIHYRDNNSTLNLSDYVATELHQDYSALSKLFSEVEGKTIERYYIEQRIERVKELIKYNKMSLTQIALQMNYSSVAYLSSQFKSVTGMTPTDFKALKINTRKELDKI